jgi:hypothetical protein
MGMLSSLRLPAKGDTAGENTSGEAEEETVAGKRQAWESKRALVGRPGKPRAEQWTHEDRSLPEDDHEERRLNGKESRGNGQLHHGGNPRCGRRREILRQRVPAQ